MSFSISSASSETREAKTSPALSIGTKINHFEIRSILGEGGTAIVYEAVHTKLNSAVALKVVNTDGPYGANAAARLRREAELCAAVEDPHVPKVFDLGALPDGRPYLVMEKVVGPTLESLLLRGRLGLRLGMLVLRDLLRAVEAVQRAGVVHRDIKPSNIIVQFAADRTPSVRLMDFGVSRSLFFRKGSSAALTRRGTILGTPEYMAPEQIQDQSIDVRTDVYALGVVGYEMFAGQAPFAGEYPAEVIAAVLRREHKPLSAHRPEVPHELEAVIARAMESAPFRRFKHAQAMREELEATVPKALWASKSPTLIAIASPTLALTAAHRRRMQALHVVVAASLSMSLGFAVLAFRVPSAVVREADAVMPVQAEATLSAHGGMTRLSPVVAQPLAEPAAKEPPTHMNTVTSAFNVLLSSGSAPAGTALVRAKEGKPSQPRNERASERRKRDLVAALELPAELPPPSQPSEHVSPPHAEPGAAQPATEAPAAAEELSEVVLTSPFAESRKAAPPAPLPVNPYVEP